MVQAEIDAGNRDGQSTEEHAEIRRLKAENKRLREDVAILKPASVPFFDCAGRAVLRGLKDVDCAFPQRHRDGDAAVIHMCRED